MANFLGIPRQRGLAAPAKPASASQSSPNSCEIQFGSMDDSVDCHTVEAQQPRPCGDPQTHTDFCTQLGNVADFLTREAWQPTRPLRHLSKLHPKGFLHGSRDNFKDVPNEAPLGRKRLTAPGTPPALPGAFKHTYGFLHAMTDNFTDVLPRETYQTRQP